MNSLFDWLDHRTGYRRLMHEALNENVPGGARWRYVWGSTLTFAFFMQVITGLVLWMAYNPSNQTAWESVYYIQHEMWGGWLLRGLHHYTAQLMTLLLVLHLMQVVIDGAYKAPREVNFWTGIALLMLVMGLSLTGYLLPWDQKGFWASKVATSISAVTPVIGADLQKLIIGGTEYGHHTLSRFFALHAGVLPGLIVVLIAGHVYLFRRHGLTARQPRRNRDVPFWPDQVFCDVVACLAVLAAVVFLTFWTHGAELGSPADPAEQYEAARPEWYFMFLFELLKYFPASKTFLGLNLEVWGAMILPGLMVGLIVAMPLIGNWKLGHRFNLGVLALGLGFFGVFTWLAYAKDGANASFQVAKVAADRQAERVVELARLKGIPPTGALTLLREDPLTQGPKLFAQHCASCHRYDGHDALGNPVKDPAAAPDLKGFASREWLAGFLDPEKIVTAHYYGGTKFAKSSKMVRFVQKDVAEYDADQKAMLAKVVKALSAEAMLPAQVAADAADAAVITEGKKLLGHEDMRCTECHKFHNTDEDADAPSLTGYGSREWLAAFISNPAHERFYGDRNDRMPAYAEEKTLDERAIGLLTDWLRGDWVRTEEVAKAAFPLTIDSPSTGAASLPIIAPAFMATIKPFAALRPNPELAGQICELPYDVMSSEEARAMAAGNPLSFLHVSKPEIDLPPDTDIYAEAVYTKGRENFNKLITQGALRQDAQPCFYLYRQTMGKHAQVGLVAAASCQEYLDGLIKKHEFTRPDKEDDRVRHIEALNSQTGPVFLTYRTVPALDQLFTGVTSGTADVDFTGKDGVRHTAWVIRDASMMRQIETEFANIPALYIADGHHRSAAAGRVYQSRHGAGQSARFLAVIFPHNQMQILAYNRVLKDLNGRSSAELLKALESVFVVLPGTAAAAGRKHALGLYLAGQWHQLNVRPEFHDAASPIDQLDVAILQQRVLAPLFGIDDPRTSKRISFVGGIRGTAELEKLVNSGDNACAFSLFPTSIEDLMAIADAGGIMPPKSTWFEPKLRDAMFCHLI